MDIENMIYEIRGKQVMLDSDLARLYECKNGTKEINQAVKNNIEKFPERYSWVLNEEEWNFLRSKFLTLETSNVGGRGRYRKYIPRVFTEQGVAMLATIIKSKVAIQTSIRIMDAIVAMRHYIGDNELRLNNVETKLLEHDNSIKLLKESFDKLEDKKEIDDVYYAGKIYHSGNSINYMGYRKSCIDVIKYEGFNNLLFNDIDNIINN